MTWWFIVQKDHRASDAVENLCLAAVHRGYCQAGFQERAGH